MNRYRSVVLAPTLALIVACDCGGGSEVAGGLLVVTPPGLVFGEARVGLAAMAALSFSDPGDGPVHIGNPRVLGALEEELRLDGVPAGLAAEAEHTVTVFFSPRSEGAREGRIVIPTDSAITPEVQVTVEAFASDPNLRFLPPSVDFGRVPLGRTATASVEVENAGTMPVVVRAVTPDLGTTPEFGSVLDGIHAVRPGERFRLDVFYAPTDTSVDRGRLLLVDDGDAPVAPALELRGEGGVRELDVDPESIEVSVVLAGERRTRFFDLRNLGVTAQTVTRLELTGSAAWTVVSSTITSPPFTLAPGDARRVFVTYAPTLAGTATASVELRAAPSGDTARVVLLGRASPPPFPSIVVTPEAVGFGAVEVGRTSGRTIRFANRGGGDLHLVRLPSIAPSVGPFSVGGLHSPPGVLAPGDEHALTLSFSPEDLGAARATLRLESDDPVAPVLDVELTGEGSGPVPALVADREVEVGHLRAGAEVVRRLRFANEGALPLEIASIALDDDAGGRLALGAGIVHALGPAEAGAVEVRARDETGSLGPWAGRVALVSDDPDLPRLEVPVLGETVRADPEPVDLEVRATWSPAAEVRLHLLRPGGALFDRPSDCCFCAPNPDWGLAGVSEDDPLLDVDLADMGPAEIRLGQARDGDHAIVVGRPLDGGPDAVAVTVMIIVQGELTGVESRTLGPGDRWDVGRIQFASRSAIFLPDLVPVAPDGQDVCY